MIALTLGTVFSHRNLLFWWRYSVLHRPWYRLKSTSIHCTAADMVQCTMANVVQCTKAHAVQCTTAHAVQCTTDNFSLGTLWLDQSEALEFWVF